MHSNAAVFARHDEECLHSQQSQFTMNQRHTYEQLQHNTLNLENSDVSDLTVHDSEKMELWPDSAMLNDQTAFNDMIDSHSGAAVNNDFVTSMFEIPESSISSFASLPSISNESTWNLAYETSNVKETRTEGQSSTLSGERIYHNLETSNGKLIFNVLN